MIPRQECLQRAFPEKNNAQAKLQNKNTQKYVPCNVKMFWISIQKQLKHLSRHRNVYEIPLKSFKSNYIVELNAIFSRYEVDFVYKTLKMIRSFRRNGKSKRKSAATNKLPCHRNTMEKVLPLITVLPLSGVIQVNFHITSELAYNVIYSRFTYHIGCL